MPVTNCKLAANPYYRSQFGVVGRMCMADVVIVGAARTPIGGFQGVFDNVSAATLGGIALKAALEGAGCPTVDEVIMGCVLPAGQPGLPR